MILFLAIQVKLGKLTLDQIAENPKLSKYCTAVATALETQIDNH